jgi:hypothetical protein
LLALETHQNEHAEGVAETFTSVLAKLRSHLSRLVGVEGFQALLTRALALAKAEVGWLATVRVQANATLEGFDAAAQQQPSEVVAEGSAVLLAQLLGLLVTFIGEALTLRLVQDVWPEAQGDAINFSAKEARHE